MSKKLFHHCKAINTLFIGCLFANVWSYRIYGVTKLAYWLGQMQYKSHFSVVLYILLN